MSRKRQYRSTASASGSVNYKRAAVTTTDDGETASESDFCAVLPSTSLKPLHKALQAIARIGDDVFFEANADGIQWSSVNAAKSAFVAFKLTEAHFDTYQFDATVWTVPSDASQASTNGSNGEDDEDDVGRGGRESRIQYRLPVRLLMQLFKAKAAVTERHLERCEWRLPAGVARNAVLTPTLHLTFFHGYGVTKRHKLHLEEADVLSPTYQSDALINSWTAHPKFMSAWLTHFQPNMDEISLVLTQETVTIRTSMDTALDPRRPRGLATEMNVDLEDFEHFDVRRAATLTFNFKEWRTVLQYAESAQLPVSALFDRGGRPLIFQVQLGHDMQMQFIFSTISDDESTNGGASQMSAAPAKLPSIKKHAPTAQFGLKTTMPPPPAKKSASSVPSFQTKMSHAPSTPSTQLPSLNINGTPGATSTMKSTTGASMTRPTVHRAPSPAGASGTSTATQPPASIAADVVDGQGAVNPDAYFDDLNDMLDMDQDEADEPLDAAQASEVQHLDIPLGLPPPVTPRPNVALDDPLHSSAVVREIDMMGPPSSVGRRTNQLQRGPASSPSLAPPQHAADPLMSSAKKAPTEPEPAKTAETLANEAFLARMKQGPGLLWHAPTPPSPPTQRYARQARLERQRATEEDAQPEDTSAATTAATAYKKRKNRQSGEGEEEEEEEARTGPEDIMLDLDPELQILMAGFDTSKTSSAPRAINAVSPRETEEAEDATQSREQEGVDFIEGTQLPTSKYAIFRR